MNAYRTHEYQLDFWRFSYRLVHESRPPDDVK